MPNLLESIGQGLRGAGAVMSAPVYDSQNREREKFEEMKQKRAQMILELATRAVESGAMSPEKFQMIAQKYGGEGIPGGPSIATQKAQADMAKEAALQQEQATNLAAYKKAMGDYQTQVEGVGSGGGMGGPTAPMDIAGLPPLPQENTEPPVEVNAKRTLIDHYMSMAEIATQHKQDDEAKRWRELANTEINAQKLTQEKGKSAEVLKAGMNKGKREYFHMKDGVPVWTGIEAPTTEPLVRVDVQQEKAEGKAVGEGLGKQYLAIQEASRLSQRKAARFDRLNELLEGINTGKLTPLGTELASYAQSMGFDIDKGLDNKQAAVALANEIALEMRNPSGGAGMPGALSDKDLEFLKSMTPGLATTPGGRKLMSETTKKLAQRDAEVAKMARAYRKKHGGFDDGFYDELDAFSEKNPLFGGMKVPSAAPAGGNALPGGWKVEKK